MFIWIKNTTYIASAGSVVQYYYCLLYTSRCVSETGFKHRANREISDMSETTTLVVDALNTLGKDRVDDGIILSLRNRLPRDCLLYTSRCV